MDPPQARPPRSFDPAAGAGADAKAGPLAAPEEDGRVARARHKREERRAQLLDTALSLFAQRGYHATSIDDIIKASAVARGTFYLYFPSKRAIFDAVLDSFSARLAAAVRRVDVSPGAPSPLDQVHAQLDAIFAILASDRRIARLLIREAVGLDEEFDKKLDDFYGAVSSLIARALRNGMAMGLVRPLDPQVVAHCVLGSVKEVVERLFVVGEAGLDARAAARELVQFNLRAVFL